MELPKTYVIQSQVDWPNGQGCEINFFKEAPIDGVTPTHVQAAVINDREEGIFRLGVFAEYLVRGSWTKLASTLLGREPVDRYTTIHLALREITADPLELGSVAAVVPLYLTKAEGLPPKFTLGKLNTNPAGTPLLTV